MPPNWRPDGGPDGHDEFINQMASRKQLDSDSQRPAPLSAEEHAAHRKQLAGVEFVQPKFSDEHEINLTGIFGKWKRYCTEGQVGEWETTLQNVSRELMMDFFLFVCESYKVRSWGTSKVYIRQFFEMYTTVSGKFMNRNHAKALYHYHDRVLIPRFRLRPPNVDGKPVVSAAELEIIVAFNIAYDTSTFPSERQRIQIWGCYLLLCYTGARPGELVEAARNEPKDGSRKELFRGKLPIPAEIDADDDVAPDKTSQELDKLLSREPLERGRTKALCYEDICMMIVRHPESGRTVPAMAIKFVHHKGADRKPRPTIFYFTPTQKQSFCVVSLLISLALHDQAFAASHLTNAASVLQTPVLRGTESTLLRWKKPMLKIPVFRRITRDGMVSGDQAMLYSTLRDIIRNQSLDAGFEKHWTPRFFRRGAGNAANGKATAAVRDQIMRHDPRFTTFHNAYLNEKVVFDIQNTFLGEQTEDQLYKLFAHVSLTRDPRATRDMVPDAVWGNMPPDPEITALRQRRAELKAGSYLVQGHEHEEEVRQLTDEIRLKTAQLERQTVKEWREYYFYNRSTWDIERQAIGEPEEEYAEPTVTLSIPERAELANYICGRAEDNDERTLLQKQIASIDLMVALCGKRETRKLEQTKSHCNETSLRYRGVGSQPEDTQIKEESPDLDVEPYMEPFPLLLDPKRCPDCFGDERLTVQERTFRYCRKTVRDDHFDDHHLQRREQAAQRGEAIRCQHPKCRELIFAHLDHFKNHVASVHGVWLRCSQRIKKRRAKKLQRRQMAKGKPHMMDA